MRGQMHTGWRVNLGTPKDTPPVDNTVKVSHMTPEEIERLYPRKKDVFYVPNYGRKFKMGQI